jgi:uncharacterized protein involved in exopolysaccharide biosynthesis
MSRLPPQTSRAADDEVSLFALASAVVEHRGRVIAWAIGVAVLVAAVSLFMPLKWTAGASFTQGDESADVGLRSLAGQLGVSLPGGGASTSPMFYRDLLLSSLILGTIVDDTVAVPEAGGSPRTVGAYLRVETSDTAWARELGILRLRKTLSADIRQQTGVVGVSATTNWPTLSQAIVKRLLQEVMRFDRETRQSRGAQERRFVQGRLLAEREALAEAEDRLQRFLETNRQVQHSVQLQFERDRLRREVTVREGLVQRLAEAYEEARIREARDVPALTVVEAPRLPARPNPRRRVFGVLVGFLSGATVGMVLVLAGDLMARRRATGDPDAERLVSAWRRSWRWPGRGRGVS